MCSSLFAGRIISKDEDVNKLNEDLKKIQAAMDWGAKTKP